MPATQALTGMKVLPLNNGEDMGSELSDLSTMIGELRNFAAAQLTTNAHILAELKQITQKTGEMGALAATFVEYRKTNHERWNNVHVQLRELDEHFEKHDGRIHKIEEVISGWSNQLKMVVAFAWLTGTVAASLLSEFGGHFIKALTH